MAKIEKQPIEDFNVVLTLSKQEAELIRSYAGNSVASGEVGAIVQALYDGLGEIGIENRRDFIISGNIRLQCNG